ncbi:hypothetical protein HOI26_03900 [Candidatus Woesearchaeota archaeon]|jgi:hypothetical protein|nr:hypothetical protein [Candidatus Woesearchaeota archaeon]MBT5740219.1 hypothetical protein [Candidatus Woesearchaeota archaeon]
MKDTINKSSQQLQHDEDESAEEGFMKGYSEEETIEECAECGSALHEQKKVVKQFDGDAVQFCSADCAEDFAESI